MKAALDADVIVVGGGSAGVAAAVGASRAGAETLLLERGPCLGGASTMRNVLAYGGLYAARHGQVVQGVAEEVLAGLRRHGAVTDPWPWSSAVIAVTFEPEPLKLVLDEVCRRAGVRVRLHSHVFGAVRRDEAVQEVSVADHGGVTRFRGAAWVDASGEADLADKAGAEVRYGNDGMVQNGTLGVRFGGIPPDVDLSGPAVAAAVEDAKRRGVLGPSAAATGFVARLPLSGDVITYLADEGYDARSADETSRAEASARAQASAYLAMLRSLPGCARAWIVSTGPEIGTRESRHVVARRPLTADEILDPAPVGTDAVAVGAWPHEYHPAPGVPSEWRLIGGEGIFGIPLDVLRSRNTPNLLAAGRAVDGDRGAGSSVRVMGTAFGTGHAAGVAAARLAATGGADVDWVRRELRRQAAWLP